MSKKPAGKKEKANQEILKTEDVLQAIILADSFDQKFMPITLEEPRALLPLVNIPLLDYTIEFLVNNKVQEIYVFCCAHAKKIQDYISKSKWSRVPGLLVKTIVGLDTLSAGQALRAINDIGCIKHDFVLIQGDVISNMSLAKALSAHKSRREKDKSAIMTTVLKKAEPTHRTRSLQDDVIVAIEKPTGKLLFYESRPEIRKVNVPLEIFNGHTEVQFRYDMLDCRIDICAPEVLLLFADNFDYEDLRQDFIRGVLTDDILSNKIFAHVISGEYAARVRDLRTYNAVSKDIVHRWTYPMVPDSNLLSSTSYTLGRNLTYKEQDVKIFNSNSLGDESVVGEGTEIGPDAKILQSIIGRNVTIGARAHIIGSYIWDGATIEEGAVIKHSIVGRDAKILANTKIDMSLISYDVVIGPDLTLESGSKVTTFEDEDDDDEITQYLEDVDLGDKGFGRLWTKESEPTNSLVVDRSVYPTDLPEEEEKPTKSQSQEQASTQNEQEKFTKEARDIIHISIVEKHSIENFVLELNSLKYAFNTTFADCLVVILHTLLDEVKETDEKNLLPAVQKILTDCAEMMVKFVQSRDDQVELIWGLQDYCDAHPKYKKIFPIILHTLFNNEVLEEDAIWKWVEEQDDDKTYVTLSDNFLNWLKTADEEDEDDDDDNEEEED